MAKAKKSASAAKIKDGADDRVSPTQNIGIRMDLVKRADAYGKKLTEVHGFALKRGSVINALVEKGLKAEKA